MSAPEEASISMGLRSAMLSDRLILYSSPCPLTGRDRNKSAGFEPHAVAVGAFCLGFFSLFTEAFWEKAED